MTGKSGVSCTDIQQQWNKGTTRNLEPKRLEDISFKRKHRDSELADEGPVVCEDLPSLPSYQTHEQFLEAVNSSAVSELFNIPGTLLHKAVTAKCGGSSGACEAYQHSSHSDSSVTCGLCQSFYETYVNVSSDQCAQVETLTKEQSLSQLWKDTRRIRITASTAKKVPVRDTTNPDRFLREQMYPSFRGNANTEHGRESEPKALDELRNLGLTISSHGAFISEDEPWLSASPDGIDSENSVIEVKCPVLKSGENFKERLAKGVSDVVLHDEIPHLSENGCNGYYKQVQLTMFCTGKKSCKFFVWSEQGHVLINIEYNDLYVNQEVSRLKQFYFQKMLPRLADDFRERRLKLSADYVNLVTATS